jgi:hypothetical protein
VALIFSYTEMSCLLFHSNKEQSHCTPDQHDILCRVKVSVLGSREQLCIHEHVRKEMSNAAKVTLYSLLVCSKGNLIHLINV